MQPSNDAATGFRAGYTAIIGVPNAGKSTLLNRFLSQKIAIVTRKPQTTRNRILGIYNQNRVQIVFLDTPGLLEPRYLLQEAMLKTAHASMKEADLILYLADCTKPVLPEGALLAMLESMKTPVFLVINKVDRLDRNLVLPLMDRARSLGCFQDMFPVSALTGENVDSLLDAVVNRMPEGTPFYPPEQISDEPERFFVAEIIREKIFRLYGEEIPYATAVSVEQFRERPGQKDYIQAVITVEQPSQKGILIGKGGQALKRVGTESRQDIERFLNRGVFLELVVQVRKKWRKDPRILKQLGY